MADKAGLTRRQTTALRSLADGLPYVDDSTWRARAAQRFTAELPAWLATITRAERQDRARDALLRATGDAVRNRGISRQWRGRDRARERRILRSLVAVCGGLFHTPMLRARLYVAAEDRDGWSDPALPPGLLADGCLVAKHRDEGGAGLGVTVTGTGVDLSASVYDRVARHPGPWVRDDLERLRAAALHVLGSPPFHATKHDPYQDLLVVGTQDAWWWATGVRATAGSPNRSGPSPFARVVRALFEVVDPRGVTDAAIAKRIRAALRRPRGGAVSS